MQTFYVLMIANHKTKEFNVRVEDGTGNEPGSIHSLTCYITTMTRQVTKYQHATVKPYWMFPFWHRVTTHSNDIMQSVVATIEAEDVRAARAIFAKKHRNALKHLYTGLGYTSFYAKAGSLAQIAGRREKDLQEAQYQMDELEIA